MKFILRESVDTDSVGNTLSQQQSSFFKDSKIRDSRGRLLLCHHGSPNKDIDTFYPNSFFSASKGYASEYMYDRDTGEPGHIYDVYLNITKPFDNSTEEMHQLLKEKFIPWCKSKGYRLPKDETLLKSPVDFAELADNLYVFLKRLHRQGLSDYDGLIVDEQYNGKYGSDAKRAFVPLFSNQIKSARNTHPTVSGNINESSLSEIYPNKGESKKDFISRFMSVTKDEYPDIKQRYAIANSYWERRTKGQGD